MVASLPCCFVFAVGQGRPCILSFLQCDRWRGIYRWLPRYVFREPGAPCGILKVRGMKGSPRRRIHRRVEESGLI